MAYHGEFIPTGKPREEQDTKDKPERQRPPEPDPLLAEAVERLTRQQHDIEPSR